MNQYRILDMSNERYLIKGISLGKNINSYFCMNKGSYINKIVIVDKDVMSVLDGQVVFSIKNVSIEWVNNMVYSFCHFLSCNKYNLKNIEFEVDTDNINLRKQIEDFLIRIGVFCEREKEAKSDLENTSSLEKKESIKEEFKPKENLMFRNDIKKEDEKYNYVELVSEFDMGSINEDENDLTDFEELDNSGHVALPMTLFILSAFLFVASFVLYIKT